MKLSTDTKNMAKKDDCLICAESVSYRRMVKCQFCNFSACEKCVSRFLMGIDDDRPRCMSPDCKKVWSYEFLAAHFPPSFHNNKYRNRRAELLLEREMSLMPGTQELVLHEKRKIKKEKQIRDLQDENAMYNQIMRKNNLKIMNLRSEFDVVKEEKTKSTFTRGCPVETCRGFLSTSLKCGICKVYACKDCHLPKNGKNDEEHKCDPDLVATVKLLASDTKPCPGCMKMIYKIHGCDQMYCTQCHTAFSWEKGTIERGVIHNPHFYEFQRSQNGGVAPRVNGDIRCGGLPNIWDLEDKLEYSKVEFPSIHNVHRLINHINNVELDRFPITIGDMDNSRLRVDYLMNNIDRNKLKSLLKQRMKKQEKDYEINMVLSMFTTTSADMLRNIIDGNASEVPSHLAGLSELREYTNSSLVRIGHRFKNIVPFISNEWEYYANVNMVGKKKKRSIYQVRRRDYY